MVSRPGSVGDGCITADLGSYALVPSAGATLTPEGLAALPWRPLPEGSTVGAVCESASFWDDAPPAPATDEQSSNRAVSHKSHIFTRVQLYGCFCATRLQVLVSSHVQ